MHEHLAEVLDIPQIRARFSSPLYCSRRHRARPKGKELQLCERIVSCAYASISKSYFCFIVYQPFAYFALDSRAARTNAYACRFKNNSMPQLGIRSLFHWILLSPRFHAMFTKTPFERFKERERERDSFEEDYFSDASFITGIGRKIKFGLGKYTQLLWGNFHIPCCVCVCVCVFYKTNYAMKYFCDHVARCLRENIVHIASSER